MTRIAAILILFTIAFFLAKNVKSQRGRRRLWLILGGSFLLYLAIVVGYEVQF
ncbi:hypothetical protein VST7929_01624 [Vibrio stylophorae]|uniref:Uncharacterized protein n=1 Tax=Vibrio stylophorae TaxID=659351 RepID=A0ABM8ZTV8_9VIBR|nr:hypothetical protein [Vibrio stylophorae]CAH0533749.1 hypothetical protein VST7929_01624 [Vibrio stylophorae]